MANDLHFRLRTPRIIIRAIPAETPAPMKTRNPVVAVESCNSVDNENPVYKDKENLSSKHPGTGCVLSLRIYEMKHSLDRIM